MLVLGVAFLFCAGSMTGEPRKISEAEEAAVRLVAAHLTSGASVLWDATSATSRLRALGAAEGKKEIELRTGPPAGSEWSLVTIAGEAESLAGFHVTFESGIDDTLIFEMVRENGVWKLADIRSMSDPVAVAGASVTDPQPVVAAPAATRVPLMILGAIAVVCAAASFATRKRWRLAGAVFAASGLIALLAGGVIQYRQTAGSAEIATASAVASPAETVRAMLVDLRVRAASGEDVAQDVPTTDSEAADRAALWNAQLHLGRNDFAGAAEALSKVRDKDIPLAHVLAGRTAFLQNRDLDAVVAYERAIELGPERDDLLYEAASVLMTAGFRDRAERYFRRLAAFGSREPDTYYSLAVLESWKGTEEKAEKALFTAYAARPQLRASLIKSGVLYRLLRRTAVRKQLAIHRSEEPLIRPVRFAERPLELAPGVGARCIGEHLEVDFSGSKLQVPGGAFMAPASAPVLDAGAWERAETAQALGRAPRLASVAAQPSTYAQPALARRVAETASTLAAHHRWNEVAELTAGVTPSFALVPAELLLLKAEAQKRTGKTDAARLLLREIAASPSLMKRLDARQLIEAGEMLASLQSYDMAIRMMDLAGRLQELPHLDDRVRQLTMHKRLAQFDSHKTPHFIIRYSSETGPLGARMIGDIAEAELERLQKWIPITGLETVVINVLSWETFRGVYTGSDHILGFYDGQITIPFAGVGYYPPEIVAILSHELAHAMIAQRTRDQAPRWFQEGLAQRIESIRYKPNPFNMYEPEQFLAFRLLDETVTHSPDPAMIGQGYLVAHALVRFIEEVRGKAALVKLLDAFAAGAPTDEAIEAMSGQSLADFDQAFAAWGHGKRDVFENTNLVSYDEEDRVTTGRRR
jgi:tetratricopeptide (TPR) repeat protein